MAGVFNDSVLTRKGVALLAKAQAGRCTIALTKAALGNGSYSSGEDLTQKTALKSKRQEFSLTTVRVQNATNVYVKFIATNNPPSGALNTGYYVKEIGLFATDPDEGEILYAIATAVSGQEDFMPPYNDLLPATITFEFLATVANAEETTIEAPNKMYLYDDATGDRYVLGVNNGLLYFEEDE